MAGVTPNPFVIFVRFVVIFFPSHRFTQMNTDNTDIIRHIYINVNLMLHVLHALHGEKTASCPS